MARKVQQDQAKAKAAKQKKILIVGCVLLVALLAYEGPKTMKLMSGKRAAPITDASAPTPPTTTDTTTTAAPTPAPTSVAAPSIATPAVTTPSTPSSTSSGTQLIAAAEPAPDPGQLQQFYRFASKDPFAAQAPAAASSSSSSKSSKPATKTTTTSTPPAAPPPSSAVISVNGLLGAVSVGAAFPTSGPVYGRVGALFQLLSLTQTTAKVIVVGGSYADGSQALTLTVGKAVTLQNTADGTRYTLLLEPQGTAAPTTTGASSTTPTTTTPVVPSATTTTTTTGG